MSSEDEQSNDSSNGHYEDAQATRRSIVVESVRTPKYSLHWLSPQALQKFESDYSKYESAVEESTVGQLRSKVSCFNDRILRYIARFKLEGMSSKDYLRITEEQLQEVIDQQLSLESIRSADKRSIEDIAKKELV